MLLRSKLVVLEAGVPWRDQMMVASTGAGRIVVIQDLDEEPASLASRVGRRLKSLYASGGRIEAAVLGCGERMDDAVLTARARILCAAGATLNGAGGDQLVVSAPERLGSEGKQGLRAFLTRLMDTPGHDFGVSLCFGDDPGPVARWAGVTSSTPRVTA